MLFLSGTRDALAAPELLNAVVAGLGDRAHLHWLDTADHSYRVQKRMRQRSDSIFEEMAEAIAHWSLQRS
jgi:predicted alpha/beta-hydrolase family hydrolase